MCLFLLTYCSDNDNYQRMARKSSVPPPRRLQLARKSSIPPVPPPSQAHLRDLRQQIRDLWSPLKIELEAIRKLLEPIVATKKLLQNPELADCVEVLFAEYEINEDLSNDVLDKNIHSDYECSSSESAPDIFPLYD